MKIAPRQTAQKRPVPLVFRRPEPIEVAVAAIGVVLLLYVAAFGLFFTTGFDRVTVLLGSGAGIVSVVLPPFLARRSCRVGLLVLQFVACLLLLPAFHGARPDAEVLLLVLLVMNISLRFPVPLALTASAVVFAATTLVGLSLGSPVADRIAALVFGGLALFLAEMAVIYRERLVRASNTIDFQARSLENLAAANHSFVAHLESAKAESAERERFMITRELHDAIGYSLTNIAMMMNASRYLMEENPDKLAEYCRKTRDLATSTLQETRGILYKLRAVTGQTAQSPPLFFTRLCRDFAQATGVTTECHLGNLPSSMGEEVFTTLFRSVQVGFINALRHGSTAHIRLAFWLGDAELRMQVWNDSPLRLPDVDVAGEGIGLRGVRERLQAVNGRLSYGPVADGFEMVVTIPMEENGIG